MFVDALFFLVSLVLALLFFALTIAVHELGHLVFAKWRGMVVERFAIGFGPKIFGFRKWNIDFWLCAVPFGGYVALPQLAPMEMVEGETEKKAAELPKASSMDKIWAAFGGPLFSFLFGVFFAVILSIVGKPTLKSTNQSIVGYVDPTMPAYGKIEPGDEILRVDGKVVTEFFGTANSLTERIMFSDNPTIKFDLKRPQPDGTFRELTVEMPPAKDPIFDVRAVGIRPRDSMLVDHVISPSPAADAGLRSGDRILTAGGQRVYSIPGFLDIVSAHENKPLRLEIERGKELMALTVVPEKETEGKLVLIGVTLGGMDIEILHIPVHQLVWDSVVRIKRTLTALTNTNSDVKIKHMSGWWGILERIMDLLSDPRNLLWFSVMLNINLAIVNMLPLPILDGGHITQAAIEGISRRPVPPDLVAGLQNVFALLLLCLLLYLTYHDIDRTVRRQQLISEKMRERGPNKIEFPERIKTPQDAPEPATP